MKGLENALHRLEQLVSGSRTALERAVRQAGEAALQAAQKEAPVRTGNLRNSIAHQSRGLISRVATHCPYAGAVELGTLRTPAQPFLWPAARDSKYFQGAQDALREMMK